MTEVDRLHDEGWQATACRSDLYRDPTTPSRQAKLRRCLAALPKGSRILDYGCGRGEFCEFFQHLGLRPVGIDLSKVAIDFNRNDLPEIEFHLSEAGRPAPVPDAAFDAVWCSEVVEHVYDVHAIFKDFARVLKPGGLLILTTPYHGILKNIALALHGFDNHFNVEWQHIRFWTKASLAKVAAAHGLTPVTWDTIGRIPVLAKSFFVVFRKA